MREDLFIGDVRMSNVSGDAYYLNSRLLGHVPLERELMGKEKALPAYGKTGNAPSPTAKGSEAWGQPDSSLGPTGLAPRLRLAALPKIDAARVTGADVGGGGAAGVWNFIVGGGVSSEQTLMISLSGIETLELDDAVAIPAFIKWLRLGLSSIEDVGMLTAFCANAKLFGKDAQENTRISMVTRALYARGIDYSYGDTFGAALRASAGAAGSNGVVTDAFVTPGGTGTATTPAAPSVELSKFTAGAPGIAARISRASRDGLSLTEIFERPLAFGADVVAINPFTLVPGLSARCEKLGLPIFTGPLTTTLSDPKAGIPG
jgi:hypothetical protein